MLSNAIRVLIFLNDRDVVPLTRHLRSVDGPLGSLAWMIPAILDASEELPLLEAVAVAPETKLEQRAAAIAMAAHLGADPGRLLEGAAAVRPQERRGLETLLMLQAMLVPFPKVVPLLSAALDEDPIHHRVLSGILFRLAETSFPGTESLLIKALASPEARLVLSALAALQRCRYHAALAPILKVAQQPELRAIAIPAALASGPVSTQPFRDVWQHASEAAHWRWVLAGRLRDSGEASELVAIAVDATQDWKVRRLAILAAGRLPFAEAMRAIAPIVLGAPVLLVEDSQSFQTHGLLTVLLEAVGARDLLQRFRRGRDAFLQVLVPIYAEWTKELIDSRGILPALDAVGWLWDRLDSHAFGSDSLAVDAVANELHVPMLQAAVLLGLRRQGRRDDIFTAFERASTNWLRIRAFNELCHGEPLSIEDERRAQALMNSAPPMIQFAIGRIFKWRPRREPPPAVRGSEGKPESPAHIRLDFEQAQAFQKSVGRVDSKAIVLDLDERELGVLVVDLDPTLDTEWQPAPNARPARVSLSETSWRLKGGFALEQTSPHYDQRSALRPAVAAANSFGIDIPWHRAELTGDLRDLYADRFFASLGARNDRDEFVRLLLDEAELLVPLLERSSRGRHVLHLVDERLLPVFDRFAQAGHGVFFQQLCTLICQVKTDAVLPSLAKAFRRWLVQLDQLQASPDHTNSNTPEWRVVWQTLSLIQKHPHFDSIPQVRDRLLEVLIRHGNLWHGHRESILELLKEWPAAYLRFETEVFRLAVFEHYYDDKVAIYDGIADSLFHRTR